ncbi:MAG: hypothetical protein GSR77_07700 [Desulfurococcales archaeon]|nr:hypothetical protein [Desulfurococcales archaeon]
MAPAEDEKYNLIVIVYGGSRSSGSIVLATSDNVVPLVPARDFVRENCNYSSETPNLQTVNAFETDYNGTRYRIIIVVDIYHGCSHELEVLNISKKISVENKIIRVYIRVATPPVVNLSTSIPLMMDARNVTVLYRYVNETYIELDIELKEIIPPTIQFLRLKYKALPSVEMRFLVDTRTWQASYWDGNEWIPVGYMPLATPGLNVSKLLRDLYTSYREAAQYYIDHPQELDTIMAKVRTFIENNESDKVNQFINSLVYGPLPGEWKNRDLKLNYLGYNYTLDMFRGSESTNYVVRYTIPNYTNYIVNAYIPAGAMSSIKGAIMDYLQNDSTYGLEQIVREYNGFVRIFREHDISGNFWGGMPVYILNTPLYLLPATLPIPAEPFKENYNVSVVKAMLEISKPSENKPGLILYNTTLDDPRIANFTRLQYSKLIIAIDTRLAEKFSVYNITNVRNRAQILENLLSKTLFDYRITWYRIISMGKDPEVELSMFINNLTLAVYATALQLGDNKSLEYIGLSAMSNTSSGAVTETPSGLVDTIDQTSNSVMGKEGENSIVEDTRNWDSKTLIIIGVILVVVASLIMVIGRGKPGGVA